MGFHKNRSSSTGVTEQEGKSDRKKLLIKTAKTRAKELLMFRGRSFWATAQAVVRQQQ